MQKQWEIMGLEFHFKWNRFTSLSAIRGIPLIHSLKGFYKGEGYRYYIDKAIIDTADQLVKYILT